MRAVPKTRGSLMQRTPWRMLAVILAILVLASIACEPDTGDERSESSSKSSEGGGTGEEADMRLISAAGQGDLETVKQLLDDGASVEARDETGRTALVAAAYENHLDVAKTLIKAGADVNAKDETEQSAYLISTAEVGDDPRLLRLTLDNGADVRSLDSYNGTGLIRAADRGYVEVVRELLETDIDVDHINNLGWTALLEAIILGGGDAEHTKVVQLLVDANADVNLADSEGVTPLEHARRRNYEGMVEILESAGAR